jgi:hypothetical protein
MSDNPKRPLKIGVKYCGGCRPDYDRTALVSKIAKELGPDVEFVSADNIEASKILAVEGCQTACADLTPFDHLKVWTITSEDKALDFIKHIKTIKAQG